MKGDSFIKMWLKLCFWLNYVYYIVLIFVMLGMGKDVPAAFCLFVYMGMSIFLIFYYAKKAMRKQVLKNAAIRWNESFKVTDDFQKSMSAFNKSLEGAAVSMSEFSDSLNRVRCATRS